MGWDYTDDVKDHFLHPRNVGEMENPDGRGEVGSIVCGDALSLTIKVDKEHDIIEDAKFKTFGCGSAIASSSALTEMVKGKTIDEALSITNEQIADYLGGLPQQKMHCSVMGREALEAAIADYRGENWKKEEEEEGTMVCYCFSVTDKKIERAIRENNLKTVEDVTNYTKAGGGCTSCLGKIEEIIERVRAEMDKEQGKAPAETAPAKKAEVKAAQAAPAAPKKKLTNLERMNIIQKVINEEIRPALVHDGGDIILNDIDGTKVSVSLIGACAECQAVRLTGTGIEKRLSKAVGEDITLEIVPA